MDESLVSSQIDKIKDVSDKEKSQLLKAFGNAEFRDLFQQYVDEIRDPVNRQGIEESLRSLDEADGMKRRLAVFNHEFVLKTLTLGGEKCFINVVSSDSIGKPECGTSVGGVDWKVPISALSKKRDVDKKGSSCWVFDVMFHPDAIGKASECPKFRRMLVEIAMNSVESTFDVKIEKGRAKRLRRKYMGEISGREVIIKEKEVKREPKYSITECVGVCGNSKPDSLIVRIELPLCETSEGVHVETNGRVLSLHCDQYEVAIDVGYEIDSEKGAEARFFKEKRLLELKVPLKMHLDVD